MSEENQSTTVAVAPQANVAPGFTSVDSWKLANRIAEAFSASNIVPKAYIGNVANCIVALEMANRIGASPLMVMQNLYVVHGNPSWSSKFLIACFNQSGKYSALRYEWETDAAGKRTGCRAWAIEKATGERLVGSTVTLEMAKVEGWGAKWKSMPEQMLMYRAATFMIRTYAPEISMGLPTDDEMADVGGDASEMLPAAGKPEVRATRRREPAPLAERVDTPAPTAAERADADGVLQDEPEPQAEQEPQADEQPATTPEPQPEPAATKPATTAAAPAKTAAAPSQTIGNSTLASTGERKMLVNRAKSNNVSMAELIEKAGIGPMNPETLDGLTRDGFVALRDMLPKAA